MGEQSAYANDESPDQDAVNISILKEERPDLSSFSVSEQNENKLEPIHQKQENRIIRNRQRNYTISDDRNGVYEHDTRYI